MHKEILDADGKIDPFKIDTVARMGGNWYSRAKEGIFEVEKPLRTLGIGVDSLPLSVKLSKTLTGNDLGMLANVEMLPDSSEIDTFVAQISEPYQYLITSGTDAEIHEEAQSLLQQGNVHEAWLLLLSKK